MLPMRMLVVDDHHLFRQGLIGLLKTRPDLIEVVGEAASGEEAIKLVSSLKPDVILMDITMPHGDGLEATACIHEHFPGVNVIILTASESDEQLYKAMRCGASGYLLKDLEADELFDLLENVERGEVVMSKAMGARLLKQIANESSQDEDGNDAMDALTARELEVLRLVAKGYSNLQIAEELVISVNTVKVHLRHLMDKLHVNNRTQAVAYAIQCGLVAAAS